MLQKWTEQGMHGGVTGEGATPGATSAGSAAAGSDAEFDLACLESVAALDADGALGLINELVSTFERDSQEKIDGVRRQLQAGDAAAIHALTHQLKSASGTLGLSRVYRLSRQIDDDARLGGLAQATALIGQLEEALIAGRAWLREFAGKRSAG